MSSIRQNLGVKMVGCMLVVCSLVLLGMPIVQGATTTLRIADEFTMEPDQTAFQELLDHFQKLNPDIVIKREATSLDASAEMKTALRVGTGPDVIHCSGGPAWLGVLATAGLVLDLTEEYQRSDWEKELAPWGKFALGQLIYNGKYWGIPCGPEYLLMFYNVRMFKEAGIDKKPKTYDELLTACSKLQAAGFQPLIMGTLDGWAGGQNLEWMWAMNDARGAIQNIFFGDGNWENDKLIDGARNFVSLYEKGYLNKDAGALIGDDIPMLFMREEAAMYPTGSWFEGYMYEECPFEYSIFNPLPEGSVGVNLFRVFAISAKTKHKDEALRLLHYLMTFEAQKIMFDIAGRFPNGWYDRLQDFNIPTGPISKGMLQQANPQYFCIDASLPPVLWDEYYVTAHKLISGQVTPEEEMKEWQKFWEQAIEEDLPRLGT